MNAKKEITGSDQPIKEFYVYELRDDQGKVFYVGKGKGKRRFKHRWLAKEGRVKGHLYSKIRKLWSKDMDFTEVVVSSALNEKEALDEEVRLISFYGRDNLTNMTDGGEGQSGLRHSEESKKRMRASRLRQFPEGFIPRAKRPIEDLKLMDLPKEYLDKKFYSNINLEGPFPDQNVEFYKGLDRCHEWVGRKNPKGKCFVDVAGKNMMTQRLSYILKFGDVPKGKSVLRKCDNKSCVNPEHLFLRTNADSVKMKMAKGRHRGGKGERHGTKTCPDKYPKGDNHYLRKNPDLVKGVKNPFSKLDDEKIRSIRKMKREGFKVSQIRRHFEVSHVTIDRVLSGQTWSHVV